MTKKTKEELHKELESLKERLKELERADLEQKKVIEALSESEAKYRLLFDVAPVGIGIADLKGNIIDANKNMQEMSGYSLDEYRAIDVGATYADPEERKILIKALREKGTVRDWEGRLKRKDGSQYHALLNADIMELGGCRVVLGIIRDISERKRIELALNAALANAEDEKNKSEAIIAALGDGIIIQDTDYKIIYQNQVQNDIYGDKTGEFCYRAYEGRDEICDDCPVERTFRDGKIHRSEKKVPTDNGDLYFELTSSPLKDSSGKIIAGIKIVRDITKSRRVEEKFREGEQFLENIFASIQDGIGIIDGDMNIIRVNKTTESWYPHSVPLIGKKCYEAYHNRKKRCEQCPARETLKTGKSAYKLVPKHGPEGKEMGWLEIYSYPLNDITTGKMKGVIEYVRDITERKRVEEELNKSKQLLERTFLSLSDAVFIIDSENAKIIDCNKAASKIFGYEKEEMLGRITAFLHVDEEALAEFRKKLYAAEEEKGFLYLPEFRMKRKNGECFFTENTVTPLLDDIGKRLGWVSVVRDITELKRAQEALLKSEEKFRDIFEQSPIAIELYDRGGNLIDANRSCLDLFGINDIKSVIGFRLFKDPNIAEDKKKRLSNGEDIEFESAFDFELVKKAHLYETTKSGKSYIDILIVPLINEDRERYGYLVHLRDITERKRMEEELKQSEEKYRLLIENIQEGVFVIQDAKMVFVNQKFSEITGYDIEEIIGTDFYHFVAPEDLEMVKERYYRRQKGENVPKEYEFHALCKNGEKPIVNMNVGIVTYRGRIASMGILRDITEQKHSEEALRMSNLVVENSQTVLFRWKAKEGWPAEFVSNNVIQFGYDAQDFLSGAVPYASIIHPEDLERVSREVWDHSQCGDSRFKQEYRIIAKNGAVHWIDDRTVIERNMDGQITNYQGIIIDITERKNTEEVIRKYNLELEDSNRMKELFIDIMHHDLLNPLNVANGYVEFILEDETNHQKRSFLETIKRNLVKGMELIDNATKFSKLENMNYIEFKDMDLKIIIGDVVANITPLAVSAGMSIENKLKSMPARANIIIEDVFINVISNAIKYASEGKKIVVDCKDTGKFWSVRVTDFGAGIKDAQKTLIFERFHREEKKG